MAKWVRVSQEDFDRLSELWAWYERAHGRVEKFADQTTRRGPRDEHDKRVWYRALAENAAVGDAPAYGVVKIVDFHFDDVESRPYLTFAKPDAANLTNCGLIWHEEIKNGKIGRVTLDPWWALYNTAASPVFDAEWGTAAGSWELTQGNTGFKILGGATEGRVLVRRPESTATGTLFIDFELNEALSVSDETAEATVLRFWGGADPGDPVTVRNLESSADGVYVFSGLTGATGRAVKNPDTGQFEILNMQCG